MKTRDECDGKGYKLLTIAAGGELRVIKEWCDVCKGTGKERVELDRNGVRWELE